MRKPRDLTHSPRRLLPIDEAAHYCGVSAPTFEAHCPVPPTLMGRRKLWDRVAIDRWLDGGVHDGDSLSARLERL